MPDRVTSRERFAFLCTISIAALTAILALTACSGGSGGNGGGGNPLPPVNTSTPTPTFSVSGTLTDGATALSGATVTIGTLPASTCAGWAGCGFPLAPTLTATTAADGTFTVTNLVNGSYMLTISKDTAPTTAQTYAILHRQITVASANVALGSVKIVKLSSDESAWIARLNTDRATIAFPATGPVVMDEYAQEQARQWAIEVDAGTTPYTDAGYAPYQTAYGAKPGSIGSAGGALDLNDTWQDAEAIWFAEKANCPGGDWRTCTFSGTTGHYINLAQDSVVWVGVGEDLAGHYGSDLTTHGFDVMTIYKGSTARTASSVIRAIAY
jgi:hypothetical protein